jgi:hypothetical protein
MAHDDTDAIAEFLETGKLPADTPLTPAGLEEAALLANVAAELEATQPNLELTLAPASALQMAGLVQLALRHPGVSPNLRHTAGRYLGHVREYFAEAPAVLELLARGDRP